MQMKFKVILFFMANVLISKNPHIQLPLNPGVYLETAKKNRSADHVIWKTTPPF